MLVPVRVRLTWRVTRGVCVLMMRIVNMTMLVRHRLVYVLVLVALRHMEVQPEGHQSRREGEAGRDRFAERNDRDGCLRRASLIYYRGLGADHGPVEARRLVLARRLGARPSIP